MMIKLANNRVRRRATTTGRRTGAMLTTAALALAACSASDEATDESIATTPPPATTTTPTTSIPPSTAPEPAPSATTTTAEVEPAAAAEPASPCLPAARNEIAQPAGIVASFDPTAFEVAEGVAVDSSGNVYVSLPPLGQIVRFAPGSSEYEVWAQVPDWDLAPNEYFTEQFGILGLALDPDGNVYAAVDSPGRSGVWKFDCQTREGTRFEGTQDMLFANALAFDDNGNLFVTESFSGMEGDIPLGAIWKITPDGTAEKWIENTTLGGPNRFGLSSPNGANGIAYRDGLLYVNVLQQTSIVNVPVLDDGSAGEVQPYVVTENAFIGDGLALDADGRVYVTDFLTDGIVRIDADGTIVPIAGGPEAGFDNATSLAWGVGATAQTLYAVNLAGGGFEPTDKPGPALIAIDVDTPGMPLP